MPTTLNFDQLLAALGIVEEIRFGDSGAPIVDVTGDSRTVRPEALFVAIAGASFDGHRAIPDAIERGASVVVGTQSVAELTADGFDLSVPYVRVPNSRHALAWSSAALNGYPSRDLSVIGITGTDGKTSTSTILESILQAGTCDEQMPNGRVGLLTTVGARILGQPSDTGFHVTTPDAPAVQRFLADMRDAGCTFAIVESTSHGLAQGRVTAVDFDVAAVTNITHEHLDYHGTWDAYASAKAELFRSLFHTTVNKNVKKDVKRALPKVAVLNADDRDGYRFLQSALAEEAARTGRNVLIRSYGMDRTEAGPDVRATDVIYDPDRTTFSLQHAGGAFDVETNLIGAFNVQNILCASAIALELQVPVPAIQRGILSLTGIVGRMERIDVGQPFLALVDFAHSPASLERALSTLRTVVQQGGSGQTGGTHEARHREASGRIIAVFGSAGLRDKEKRGLMGQVSGRLADFTVITAEDPRTEDLDEINRAIEAGLLTQTDAGSYAIVPDRSQAIQSAVDMAKPGDIVVAFGKGHERSMCFGETEFPWSDQDAVAEALNARFGR